MNRDRRLSTIEILQHPNLLIVGAPGSGKTTLIAWVATQAAQGLLFPEHSKRDLIPFVLTVRTFDYTDIDFTPATIEALTGCDRTLVQESLETDRALMLIDGLDEAPRASLPKLLRALATFRKSYPKTPVIVTSRPSGVTGPHELDLSDFVTTELLALTREEVELFIDKWCLAAEQSVSLDTQVAERNAHAAAKNLKHWLDQSRRIQRLAETPLLATILCIVHRFFGQRIPEHRVTLYGICTDVLLYEWDHSKLSPNAFVGKLDTPEKRHLLSDLARQMHEQEQVEVAEAEVQTHFERTLPSLRDEVKDARQIIEEIRNRGGVLVERRPGFFAFSHLVFQEYLTALSFSVSNYKELADHYTDPWWHEVIVLAAGAPGADAGRLVKGLLRKKGEVATLIAAQCLETAVQMPLDVREKIEHRLNQLVPPKTEDEAMRLVSLGIIAAPALIQSLDRTRQAAEALCTLYALAQIDYEPAINAIGRFVIDHTHRDTIENWQATAMITLAFKAQSSKLAKTTFVAAIPSLLPEQASALATVLRGGSKNPKLTNENRKLFSELLETLSAIR